MSLTFTDASAFIFGSLIEDNWKCLKHIYSALLPNGSFIAFDMRVMLQFAGAVEKVSWTPKAWLEARAAAMRHHFICREAFCAMLGHVGQRMPVCLAANFN
jgi:hypothetical protein